MKNILIIGDPKGTHSLTALRSYSAENITVWENDPRHTYTIKQISDRINVTTDIDSVAKMHFTQTIGNPPYLKNIHLEFLLKALSNSDNVSLIHPAGWLYRTTKDIERQVKNALKGRVRKLKFFNGNHVFAPAQFAAPLVITYAVKKHVGPIEIEYDFTGNKYYIDSLDDLPSGYWEPNRKSLEIFVNSIKQHALSNNAYNYVAKLEDCATDCTLKAPEICGDGRAKDKTKDL